MTYLYLVEKERFNEGFMVNKEIRGEWGFMCSIQCDYSKEHKEIFPNVRSDIFGLHLLQTEIRLDTEDDEDYCLSSTGRAGGNICMYHATNTGVATLT